MHRKPFLVLCLLLLVALEGSPLAAGGPRALAGDHQSGRLNSWTARSSTGRTLAGTWTAVTDPKTGTVTGTWTVDDAQRRPIARGGWSAAKSRTGWTGSWRAIANGSKTEYSGTWSADVNLEPDAHFPDLFKMAVKAVVSGSWRAGSQSGAWSIRVFE